MSEIQHTNRAHGPAQRFLFLSLDDVPATVKLSEQFEDKPSTYAEEGTFLHGATQIAA